MHNYFIRYEKIEEKCMDCKICTSVVKCPSPDICAGCSSCYLACPYEAIRPRMVSVKDEVYIVIDGEKVSVPSGVTLKLALEFLGYKFSRFPEKGDSVIYAPCETGGCYTCSVIVDGELRPLCHTVVREGMNINMNTEDTDPLRIVEGYIPHTVGGVGTPWWIKGRGYIEVACFAAGCNLRCPTCQNFTITYNSRLAPITPEKCAYMLSLARKKYGVDRMAISGGEPTLNRRWLIRFFKELRRLNSDRKARLHLDTNTTVLTRDFIDELVEAGVTDIGPDIKAMDIETFKMITGINDGDLARKYLENSWDALRYMIDNYYPEKLFIGVGIPYNKAFYPDLEKLAKFGEAIAKIHPEIQVCVLDYRPEFRARNLKRPTVEEMIKVKKILNNAGLKTVIVQTPIGHIGP